MTRREARLAEAARTARTSLTGYICKKCAGPSPVGVGYGDTAPGVTVSAHADDVVQCPCGYSRRAA